MVAEIVNLSLNPKVQRPLFAAAVAAAPLQHYQVDLVHQPLGLRPPVSRDHLCRPPKKGIFHCNSRISKLKFLKVNLVTFPRAVS